MYKILVFESDKTIKHIKFVFLGHETTVSVLEKFNIEEVFGTTTEDLTRMRATEVIEIDVRAKDKV